MSFGSVTRSDVPAIGQEARGDILGEGDVGVALDGHAVAVVDPAQVGQPQMPGERGGFTGDALHHVAIAAQRVDIEVEDIEARPVIGRAQPLPRDRHADAGGHALAEWPGRCFDAGGPAVFRMARAATAGLAERLDVIQGDGVAAELFIASGWPP